MTLANSEERSMLAQGQPSLRGDLNRLGIPVPIKPGCVVAHIAADNRECRPTLSLQLIGQTWRVLQWCALLPAFRLLLPRLERSLRTWNAFMCSLLLAVLAIGWIFGFGIGTGSVLALVPILAWVTIIVLSFVWELVFDMSPTLERATSFWERHHPNSVWGTLPPGVQSLIEELRTKLPDVQLRILARDDDPFLEVRRGGERCIVAAWNTGDVSLDTVPLSGASFVPYSD